MTHRGASTTLLVVRWLLLGLALSLLATAGWVRFRFGVVAFEQVVLHLPVAGTEVEAGDGNLLGEALLVCLGLPLLILALAALVQRWWRRRRRTDPTPSVRRRRLLTAIPMVSFALSLTVLLTAVGFPQYASAVLSDRSLAPYYVTPADAGAPTKAKNLITIYLESGENTYADTELFGRNLLADLDEATAGWARYDGLQQYPGGGWTMAGLVSTQCGIPLKSKLLLAGLNPNDFGERLRSYLPGATCLGDVLAEHGYTSVFLGGAHSRFAGKETFLTDHGYQRDLGLEYWEANDEDRDNISVWGLSDQRLFSHARDALADLREAGQPFHLTILTLDTHEPAGIFASCTTADQVPMATAVTCSTRAVAGFLDDLKRSGDLDDTVVMVMGDHLKATVEGGDFKTELEQTPDRTIIFRVWSPEPVSFHRESTDQLSVLPTTLDLLGFDLDGGRAGLGVSLLDDYPLTETALALSDDDYGDLMRSPSTALYRQFWGEDG